MNLFATSTDPAECARSLDDARVVNQTRETAQLVSTAIADAGLFHPYKPTHRRHPVTRWVLADGRNFLWALDHLEPLARNEGLGLDFTHLEPTQAYRAYLAERWRMAREAGRPPRCGSRGAPWWLLGDRSTTP